MSGVRISSCLDIRLVNETLVLRFLLEVGLRSATRIQRGRLNCKYC